MLASCGRVVPVCRIQQSWRARHRAPSVGHVHLANDGDTSMKTGYSTRAITMLMPMVMMLPALAVACEARAQTVTVLQTGFEPAQGYSAGNLNGQNGWSTYLGEDPAFGEVVNAGALAGSQSVLLDGTDVQSG